MIYLMSAKFFKDNVKKLVAPKDYFIIDGENFGSTGSRSESISQNYSNAQPIGGFCPERETITIFRKIKHGDEYNEKKLKRQLKEFYKSEDFIGAACSAVKAQAAFGIDNDINIFIVLPNIVYKNIGKEMTKVIRKLIDVDDIDFIIHQDDIKKPKKMLVKGLKAKELKSILKAVKKIEKKYHLKYKSDND